MTNNERKSEYDRCAGNDGMHEDSLVEGMKELMPVQAFQILTSLILFNN